MSQRTLSLKGPVLGMSGFAWAAMAGAITTLSLHFAGMSHQFPVVWGLMAAVTVATLVWDQMLGDRTPGRVDDLASACGLMALAASLTFAVVLYARGFGQAEYWAGCAISLLAALPLLVDAVMTLAGRNRR